jgi:hypothetical protein
MDDGSFSITGRRSIAPRKLYSRLSDAGFGELEQTKNAVVAKSVQSEDIEGKPYLFVRLEFAPGALHVSYSMPEGSSPDERFLAACKIALDALQYADCYELDRKEFYQVLASAIDRSHAMLGTNAGKLIAEKQNLESALASAKESSAMMRAQGSKCETLLLEAIRKNEALSARVSQLESVSDAVLCEQIMEWLEMHGGKISVLEFSRAKGITPSRVEEGLDRLMKNGKIKRI